MNGIYSAIPYAVLGFTFATSGYAADFAISYGLPTTAVRKACTSIGEWQDKAGIVSLLLWRRVQA